MSSITCLACNVAFEDFELGRIHYKTDWHRYNLKRKVAGLVPVTLEKFEERQKAQQQEEAPASRESLVCKPCGKSFSSSNAYDNHLQSKKHKDVTSGVPKPEAEKGKKKKQAQGHRPQPGTGRHLEKSEPLKSTDEEMQDEEDDSDVESWDSCDEEALGLEECLFCSFISSSLENNLSHMTSEHSFFLPDADYICDLEGLLSYLGEKVGAGHMCLWCNEKGKSYHTSKAVQSHMLDKGHCKILHEAHTLWEFADFYDYTKSYPENEEASTDPSDPVVIDELDGDGYSLTLPSGAVIGHRSLLKYYRQSFAPSRELATRRLLPKMLSQYKALGWTGATACQVQQRARDIQFMERTRKRHFMKLGVKANKLQHHFRDSNPI